MSIDSVDNCLMRWLMHPFSHSNKANDGEAQGGAILGLANSELRVYYSQFVRNSADYGGAVFAGDFAFVEVVESLFEENIASISVSDRSPKFGKKEHT